MSQSRHCSSVRASTVFHTDVFIQIRPVNALTFPNEAPVCPLRMATMRESWVPRQRNAEGPTIDKVNNQSVLSEGYALRPCFTDFSR